MGYSGNEGEVSAEYKPGGGLNAEVEERDIICGFAE